jgi:hypothetical protein
MLARCGLKRWTHAVVEGVGETTFLRADEDIVLSLVFGRDMDMTAGLAHLDRVWTNCHHELAAEVAS